MRFGKLLLSPTRTYAPVVKEMVEKHRKAIHGIIHCSGGAQTKVLNFIENLTVVKDNLFPVPPLFSHLQNESGTPWMEMYKVFNMGHRMELYVNEDIAADLIAISEKFGVEARVIGKVIKSNGTKVILKTVHGEYSYEK